MHDRRIANPQDILLEASQLERAEAFVADTAELDRMPEPLRGNAVENSARMLVAVEVALFDAAPHTCQGLACICAVLDEETMEDIGDTRVIFASGEKLAIGGVKTDLEWFTEQQFAELNLEQIP